MNFIYLASPYTHPDKDVVLQRVEDTKQYFAYAVGKLEQVVFSPILQCHETAIAWGLPTDMMFWQRYNCHFMQACDAIHVLTLPGWEESKGVKFELDWAAWHSKPVSFVSLSDTPSN